VRVVDLFCGCGGMSLGARQAGFEVVAGLDTDPIAIQTYQRNFGAERGRLADLASLEPRAFARSVGLRRGELDLLIGGPPCQGFSKNVPRAQRTHEDPRNLLVQRFLTFVEFLRPRAIIMENVAEMKNGFGGAFSSEIAERLGAAGYAVEARVLRASEHGVPQQRRRAFFIGRRDSTRPFPALPAQAPVTVRDAIGDLPPLEHGEGLAEADYADPPATPYQIGMRAGSPLLRDHVARPLRPTQAARLASIGPGQGLRDLPDALRPRSGYSGAYGRLTWEAPAPTITRWVFHPGSGRYGHPRDPRVITIREAARLQSFPDSFTFCGSYIQKAHQVGNAVPPLLMRALAVEMARLLTGDRGPGRTVSPLPPGQAAPAGRG